MLTPSEGRGFTAHGITLSLMVYAALAALQVQEKKRRQV